MNRKKLPGRVIEYIEGRLTLSQGRTAGHPFKLHPWEKRYIKGTFSRPGDSSLSVGRGNGKSTLVGALGCAAVDVDGPLVSPGAEVIVIAASFSQGKEAIFAHCLKFLEPSFEEWGCTTSGRFRVQNSDNRASIRDRESGARLRVVGCDPRLLHGLVPRLILADEISQWGSAKIKPALAALRTSRGKIPDSKMLWIGTRPSEKSHPFQRALDGHGVSYSQTHAASEKDAKAGRLFWYRTWRKANPGLPWLPDLEEVLRAEAAEAKEDPEAMQSFRSLRLNMGESDHTEAMLLTSEAWARALELREPAKRSRRYILGVDLGQNEAMSAASAYFEDGRLYSMACFCHKPNLKKRAARDGAGTLYRRMVEREELFLAGRRTADSQELLRRALATWGRPVAIVTDKHKVNELKDHLEAIRFPLADLVVRRMGPWDGAEDCRGFRMAVLQDRVIPSHSVLLAWAISGARLVGNAGGLWHLAKNSQAGRRRNHRDDAAAAAILAVAAGHRRWHVRRASGRARRTIRSRIA